MKIYQNLLSISNFKSVFIYLNKLFLFLIPVLFFFGFGTLILIFSGELLPIKFIVNYQIKSKSINLVGWAYSEPFKPYKLYFTSIKKPEILVLGTSRVLQFRSEFFKNTETFYNAGGGVATMWQFNQFLNNLPKNYHPKILILGLDQNFFSEKWDETQKIIQNNAFLQNTSLDNFSNTWKSGFVSVYSDWYSNKFSFFDIIKNISSKDKYFGINAIVNQNGFRNDGSYYYGQVVKQGKYSEDYNFSLTFSKIKNKNERFEFGKEASPAIMKELDSILKECQKKEIYVIGFLPPYPEVIYKKIKEMETDYEYMFKLEPELKQLFTKYNFNFYNFTNPSSFGSDKSEFIDGLHCSEKAYLRILIQIAESNQKLFSYVDVSKLSNILKQSNNNLWIFP